MGQSLGASLISLLLSWLSAIGSLASRVNSWSTRSFSHSADMCSDSISLTTGSETLTNYSSGDLWEPPHLAFTRERTLFMLMPLTQVSSVVGRVMMPALASIQDDRPRVKRAYLSAISITGLITFPMMTGLFALSSHFILAILGDKWTDTIPILQLFCWVGMLQSVATTTSWILLSQGKSGLYFTIGIISSAVYVLAFAIGIGWGVWGVALAYLIVNILDVFPLWTLTGRIIGLTFAEMITALFPPFVCAGLMTAFVWAIGLVLPDKIVSWQCLAIQIPLGLASYLALVVGFKLDAWHKARRTFADSLLLRSDLLQALFTCHLRKSTAEPS